MWRSWAPAVAAVGSLVLAGAATGETFEPFEVAANDGETSETVTVTGQRMETHASDPVAASVVTEKEARLRATSSRTNLLRKVPGVTVMDLGNRSANIILRGTATAPDGDPNGAASATYFGDIPLSGLSGAALTSDLATYDMDRTEVLRGPQGTSYGGGALSGVVRNVPNAAQLDVLEGSFSTALKNTRHGSGIGYDTDGFVNVPLVDDMLAARIVGYALRDDNPIDSLLDGRSGSDNETWGARAALRFQPTEDIKLDIHYAHEENDIADLTRVEADQDFATSEYRSPGDRTIDLIYGRADWDIGFATATWIGSYSSGEISNVYNYGAWYADVSGASAIDGHDVADEENVTQELRFSAVDRKRFDWIAGLYYDERTSDSITRYLASGTDDQAVTEWDLDGIDDPDLPNITASIYDTKEEQLAFFGEVSWWFENGVGITAGVRHVRYEQSEAYVDVLEGETADGSPELLPWFPTFEAWWPRLNVSWQRNANEFYYAQYASAERPGGTNFGFFDDTCPAEVVERVEDVYDGDEIRTLEGGAKLFEPESGIAVNASVYYSRWTNAPTYNAVNCGGVALSYIDNAGEVELYGVEIEAFAPLAEGLTADLTFAWGVAEIAENDPTYTGGVKGDALPGSPEWKVSVSFDYEREIGSGLTLIAGGGIAYTGSYPNGLSGDWSYYAPFVSFPGFDVGVIGALPGGTDLYSDPGAGDYALVDANIGIEGEDWAITLFADNLLDAGGRIAIAYLSTTPDGIATLSRVTPRTVGLRVSAEF